MNLQFKTRCVPQEPTPNISKTSLHEAPATQILWLIVWVSDLGLECGKPVFVQQAVHQAARAKQLCMLFISMIERSHRLLCKSSLVGNRYDLPTLCMQTSFAGLWPRHWICNQVPEWWDWLCISCSGPSTVHNIVCNSVFVEAGLCFTCVALALFVQGTAM